MLKKEKKQNTIKMKKQKIKFKGDHLILKEKNLKNKIKYGIKLLSSKLIRKKLEIKTLYKYNSLKYLFVKPILNTAKYKWNKLDLEKKTLTSKYKRNQLIKAFNRYKSKWTIKGKLNETKFPLKRKKESVIFNNTGNRNNTIDLSMDFNM